MTGKLASYTIKADAEEPVLQAVREFVSAVAQNEPQTRYEAYRLDGGASFIHIMEFQDAESEERHRSSDYTRKFVDVLYPNCQEPPTFSKLERIG